jgi:hypothetical protein
MQCLVSLLNFTVIRETLWHQPSCTHQCTNPCCWLQCSAGQHLSQPGHLAWLKPCAHWSGAPRFLPPIPEQPPLHSDSTSATTSDHPPVQVTQHLSFCGWLTSPSTMPLQMPLCHPIFFISQDPQINWSWFLVARHGRRLAMWCLSYRNQSHLPAAPPATKPVGRGTQRPFPWD